MQKGYSKHFTAFAYTKEAKGNRTKWIFKRSSRRQTDYAMAKHKTRRKDKQQYTKDNIQKTKD